MQALVTGATGLLGRHLVDVLVAEGIAVRALVRAGSATRHLEGHGVDLIYGAAGNQRALHAAVNGVDIVFHLAGYLTANAPFAVDSGEADKLWPQYKAVNVDFTEDLLQAALETGAARFLFVSSSSVYSPTVDVPTGEDALLQPSSTYGRSKILAEEKVGAYQARGMATTIVRPSIIYGPGDRYFMPIVLRLARLPLLPLVKGGHNLMDLVCAIDVANLLWCAATCELAIGRVYNAGPGRPTTLRDLVETFRRATGKGPIIVPVPLGVAAHTAWLSRRMAKPFFPEVESALTRRGIELMSRDLHLDMSRAVKELNFQPQFDLERGLALILGSK